MADNAGRGTSNSNGSGTERAEGNDRTKHRGEKGTRD
jgi:hypothetical protein